jgi:hypothetical protein
MADPMALEIKRALEVASLIVDAYDDEQPIPTLAGIDAVNLALVVQELAKRLQEDPSGRHLRFLTGEPVPPPPRPTRKAGEVIPPEHRASWCRKPIPGIDG